MSAYESKKLFELIENLSYSAMNFPDESECKNITLTGVCADSSEVKPGNIFICIDGMHKNGHDFIPEAISRGAVLVVLEEVRSTGNIPYIVVPDCREAFAVLCNNFYDKPASCGKPKIVAVTGTNGKTTTVHMLRDIFETAGYKTGIFGTVTNTLTTPDPDQFYSALAEMRDSGVEYVFMEASSHALALKKLAPVKFEAGIFMNLTPEHLDFHGTMENYMYAKAVLMEQSRVCIINYDDPCKDYMTGAAGKVFGDAIVRFFSLSDNSADYTAKNSKCFGVNGIRYDFLTRNRLFRIDCPAPGSFTIQNSLAAAACAYELGIDPRLITEALRRMKGVPGRLERISLFCDSCIKNCLCENTKNPADEAQNSSDVLNQTGNIPLERVDTDGRALTVFIDYAHTPDALDKLLRTVRSFRDPGQKLTLLFGCGGDRDKSKRAVMGAVASRLADFVIITSDNSRTENPDQIIADIMKGIDKELPHIVISDRREAIKYAIKCAVDGEIIVLAGKGHETYEINASGKFHFDEREIVRQACRNKD